MMHEVKNPCPASAQREYRQRCTVIAVVFSAMFTARKAH